MKVIDVLCVVCYLMMMILQVLVTSGDATVRERLFKKVMINGGDTKCSAEGENYRTITLSSTLPSAKVTCSVFCHMEDLCVLFDTTGYACNLYSSVISADSACASGSTGIEAYTKMFVEDLALYKSVEYSSTVSDHLVPFSDLTSDKTTYPSYQYCPCTQATGYSWIRIDLGQTYKIVRVDVTVSFQEREAYFRTVSIHIGETGNSNADPAVGGKDSTIPGELELLEFNGKYHFTDLSMKKEVLVEFGTYRMFWWIFSFFS